MPRAWRLRPDQDGAVQPCAFLKAVHGLCVRRVAGSTFFRCCILRRRKRFFPHRAAARPSVHRVPRAVRADFRPAASFTAFAGAVRNDLARPRHSATLTNALLLFLPSPAYHRCRLRPNGSRQLFRIAHTAGESASFRIASPPRLSAHRILQSSSRQHFASASSRSRNRA